MRRPVLCAMLLVLVAPAQALKTDADQPIRIRARSVEVNEKTGVAVYRGAVSLVQGTLRVDADRIEVVTHDDQLKSIRASGNPVKLQTRTEHGETINAQAIRLNYAAPARQLDLYEQAVVHRGDDVLQGAVIRYNLHTLELIAEGGDDGQVTAIMQPRPPAP